MLTAKQRPFCAYCNGLVGFTWYLRKPPQKSKIAATKKKVENAEAD